MCMLGLDAAHLESHMNHLIALLLHQGVLDDHFIQLKQLQDDSSPNILSEVISIYFRESEKLLHCLRSLLHALVQRDDNMERKYGKMRIHVNKLLGSSSSIGAKRVTNVCIAFRAASEHANWAGCLLSLEVLEHEYCYLKNSVHELLQIEQQIFMAGGDGYHQRLL